MKMNQKDLVLLMHGEIDGTNSPAESQRLHAGLDADAEVRRQYEELCEAITTLEGVGMREPSPALRQAILAAVEDLVPTAPANTAAGGGLLRRWGAVLKQRPGYGYAFAAGLVLAIVVLTALGPRVAGWESSAREGLYGTSLPRASGTWEIDGDGIEGAVRCWRDGARILVRIELDVPDPVQVTVAASPALSCASFRAHVPGQYDLVTGPGSSRLDHAGQGVYELALQGAAGQPARITVQVQRGGASLGEHEFALP